ncbi:hypothetical protein [Pseudonocardia cypriaca]|uniref:hypothetical protein n=1 Tax=Pseudonocardia cypriaca TaxID=882449 RepID=UPI001476A876|nr:hypothetical protein [Pseudonocardia cypriaca]
MSSSSRQHGINLQPMISQNMTPGRLDLRLPPIRVLQENGLGEWDMQVQRQGLVPSAHGERAVPGMRPECPGRR